MYDLIFMGLVLVWVIAGPDFLEKTKWSAGVRFGTFVIVGLVLLTLQILV